MQRDVWRRAAETGDARALEPLLRDRETFPLHARDEALRIAASRGHGDALDVLLDAEKPPDDDAPAATAVALLRVAGAHGHAQAMWRLFQRIARGVAMHAGNDQAAFGSPDGSALQRVCEKMLHAARRGDIAAVRALLRDDAAYAHCMDESTGETAFSVAFSHGHRNVCELLLRRGAYAVGVCVDADTHFHTSMAKHPSRASTFPPSSSLVKRAVQDRNAPLVRWLLEIGASAYVPAVDGNHSALALAAYHGATEIVRILLAHGAQLDESQCNWMPLPERWAMETWKLTDRLNVKLDDPTSFLLLAIACYTQNRRFMNFLWATRKDLEDRETMLQFGTLALALAIQRNDIETVLELMSRGASTTAQLIRLAVVEADSVRLLRLFNTGVNESSSRITQQLLFVRAAKLGSIECVKEMMTTDAVRASDATRNIGACGIQAFEYATKDGHVELASLLMDKFYVPLSVTSISRCFGHAIDRQNVELLDILLAHSAATPAVIQTAFNEACMRGLSDSAAMILAYGVDVDVLVCSNTTHLLHQVISKLGQGIGFSLTAKLLLEAGANIHLVDSFGETPFAVVERRRPHIRTSTGMAQLQFVESLLQDHGAHLAFRGPGRRQVMSMASPHQLW